MYGTRVVSSRSFSLSLCILFWDLCVCVCMCAVAAAAAGFGSFCLLSLPTLSAFVQWLLFTTVIYINSLLFFLSSLCFSFSLFSFSYYILCQRSKKKLYSFSFGDCESRFTLIKWMGNLLFLSFVFFFCLSSFWDGNTSTNGTRLNKNLHNSITTWSTTTIQKKKSDRWNNKNPNKANLNHWIFEYFLYDTVTWSFI